MLISIIMASSNWWMLTICLDSDASFLHLLCSYRFSCENCLGKKAVKYFASIWNKKPKKAVFFSIYVKKWKSNLLAYFGLPEKNIT